MRDKYYIKKDRKAFLYPKEWIEFFRRLNDRQQPYFKIVENTGGRINEIRHVTPNDIIERDGTYKMIFRVTKVRAKKKETRPEIHTVLISKNCYDWLQRYIRTHKIKVNEPIVQLSSVALNNAIKKNLIEMEEEGLLEKGKALDISSHNMRKTHGNWLKAIHVDIGEIANRLHHDINTMLHHYVSPTLFNDNDRVLIINELGEDLVSAMREAKV